MKILDTYTKQFALIGTGTTDTIQFIVKKTETVVTGLTPGADYKFFVTAQNAVSSQDMNINERTTVAKGGKLTWCVYIYILWCGLCLI